MLFFDESKFHRALKEKGYRSLGQFAQELGLHRNTLHHYLSGRSVIPEGLERIIRGLDLRPGEILVEREEKRFVAEPIAGLVDTLHSDFPQVTFVLFGSRALGRAKKYSDWDIGVFSADGLPHALFRRIVRRKDDLTENLPFLVDAVNLNNADKAFLREASRHWRFLTGRQKDWITLQRKASHEESR